MLIGTSPRSPISLPLKIDPVTPRRLISSKEPDFSAEEDEEGVDESENQEEGSLGRHGGHAARNGLASATLPVRVTPRHSVTRTFSLSPPAPSPPP